MEAVFNEHDPVVAGREGNAHGGASRDRIIGFIALVVGAIVCLMLTFVLSAYHKASTAADMAVRNAATVAAINGGNRTSMTASHYQGKYATASAALAGALRENGITVKDADCSPDTAKIGERITCSFRGAVPRYGFNIPVHAESTELSMAYTKSRADR